MEKMRKKALIISLMLVIVLLSGCSAGNKSTGSDNKNTSQSTEVKKPVETELTATSTPEPTATSTPEPTATSTPVPTATSVPAVESETYTIDYEYTLYKSYSNGGIVDLEKPTGEYINGIFVLDGLGEIFEVIVIYDKDVADAYNIKYKGVGVEEATIIDADLNAITQFALYIEGLSKGAEEQELVGSESTPVPTATSTPVPSAPVINYNYTLYKGDFEREEVILENPTGEYIDGIFILDGLGELYGVIVVDSITVADIYWEKYKELDIEFNGFAYVDEETGENKYEYSIYICPDTEEYEVEDEKPVINYEYILGNGDWGWIDEKVEIENPTGEYVNGIFVIDGLGEKFNTIIVRADNYDDVANAYREKYTHLSLDYAGWFDDDNNGDGMLDFVMNLFVYDPTAE